MAVPALPKGKRRRRARIIERVACVTLTVLLLLHFIASLVSIQSVPDGSEQNESGIHSIRNSRNQKQQRRNEDSGPLEGRKTATTIQQLQQTFPIHATEWTEIPHPGWESLQFLQQHSTKLGRVVSPVLQHWPEDLPHVVQVPQFFDQSHGELYGAGSIRSYLGNHGQRLITPEEAASIGSYTIIETKKLPTIYCSIASYRDYECSATIVDLLERAEHPERIRIAIIDQRLPGDPICGAPARPCDQDPDQTLCKYQHLMDRIEVDARLAVGPVFARHLAHRHYRGEYFAMQIDAHVRFVRHWDSDMIRMWELARNEMAVLTLYLSDIDGLDQENHVSLKKTRAVMCQSDFEGNNARRHLRHGTEPERPSVTTDGQPMLQPFWAAGFSFARGHFLIQVPYDQHLPMVFQGEEISMGMRGFTYGYDYYTPDRSVCFHIYAVREHKKARMKVPKFKENSHIYRDSGIVSMKRLNTIIHMGHFPRDDWNTMEEEKYGLGFVRDTQTFFDTFGIHVDEHRVEGHLCSFVGTPMMKAFHPALRTNRMGLDYSKINYRFVDPAV